MEIRHYPTHFLPQTLHSRVLSRRSRLGTRHVFPALHHQTFSTAGGWKGQDYGKKEELEKKSFVPRNCLGAFNSERKWLLDPNNSGSPSLRAQQPVYIAINSAGDAPQWPLAWREVLWGQPGDNTSCHWAKHTMAAWWKIQIFPHR